MLILIVGFQFAKAQGTLARTYTCNPSGWGIAYIKSITLGNSLFNVYYYGAGINVQKCDLNGVPLTVKNYTFPITTSISFFLNSYAGNLYISGSSNNGSGIGEHYIMKIDTAQCNQLYFSTYRTPNTYNAFTNDAKILNDGVLVMVGSVNTTTAGNSPAVGHIIGINTAGTSSSAYSHTLSVGSNTYNTIKSITQISNSSLIFSAIISPTGGVTYYGKAIKTLTSISIPSVYTGVSNGESVFSEVGGKRFLVATTSNASNTQFFKIDTSLSAGVQHPGITIAPNTNYSSFNYKDSRIFMHSPGYSLRIIDSSLSVLASKSYTAIAQFFTLGTAFAKNNTNVFFYSIMGPTSGNSFQLIKTDLLGNMNCASSINSTTTVASTTISSTSHASGNIAFNVFNTFTLPVTTVTIPHGAVCINTGINSIGAKTNYRLNNYGEGKYQIITDIAVKKLQVFDLTGKIILTKDLSDKEQVDIDLGSSPQGIYLTQLEDINHTIQSIRIVR
jgi:hypothetical protein